MKPEVIHARVSDRLLDQADLLFRNDDSGVFVEVLQNARRAGATRLEIQIDPDPNDPATSRIVVHDNGHGIEKFQTLLSLGDSGWDQKTRKKESPAGMGFYSLCHSEVLVASGFREVRLTPQVFLGKSSAAAVQTGTFVRGTRIEFTRPSDQRRLLSTIEGVTKFCPLEVYLNGAPLQRHDFLAGSLHREWIDGIEVGFATRFEHDDWGDCPNWNFYGRRIREGCEGIKGLLSYDELHGYSVKTVYMRFNVEEAKQVQLQLPERRAIVKGQALDDFLRKARAAAYRFFERQERHVLPFKNWGEAKSLGIVLPEASPLLYLWHARPADRNTEPLFGESVQRILESVFADMLVEDGLVNAHTLEAALQRYPAFSDHLNREHDEFSGYRWYAAMPRLTDTCVFADGLPFDQWGKSGPERPRKMEIEITIESAERGKSSVRLPVEIHVSSDDGLEFTAVQSSPWDNATLDGPFDIMDFLIWAGFQSSDDWDSDTWETQLDLFHADVQRQVNEYFRGPRAALLAILHDAISWDARQYIKEVEVSEILFRRKDQDARSWDIVLVEGYKPVVQPGQ